MAIVAEIVKQSAIETGDEQKRGSTMFVEAIVYDDTDPSKTPLTQPVSIQFDRDGFLNTAKTQAARRAALADAINEQVGDKIAELQKNATVMKSFVGQVVPLVAPAKGIEGASR